MTLWDSLTTAFQLEFMARALTALLIIGVMAGVVGVFVHLRQSAFIADGLIHGIFPGIAIGFAVGGTNALFAGALVAAVVATVALTLIGTSRRVDNDAAIAVVLTSMFSIGVIVVSGRRGFTTDLNALLFGRLLTVSQAELTQTWIVAAVVLVLLVAFGKELLLLTFDPAGARAAGYRVLLLEMLANALVALVVVAGVRAVGTVLVIALLIVPAAIARLVTGRFFLLFPVAAAIGAFGGWFGLGISFDASVYHGVNLASGGTVVLTLVAAYFLVLFGKLGVRRFGR